jgi:hypothetical protein
MRTDRKSRLVAIAVGVVAVAGVASTADAQTWNGWVPYNGYNNSTYPYYQRSQDPGWTWGERYGAPPAGTYYRGQGYYAPNSGSYYGNGQSAAGQLGGLFVR